MATPDEVQAHIETAHAALVEAVGGVLSLGEQLDALEADRDALRSHNETLMVEIGDLRERIAELEAGEPPAPAPTRWEVDSPSGLSVRSEPRVSSPPSANRLSVLPDGAVVEELERRAVGDDLWIRHAGGWSAATYSDVRYLHRKGDAGSGVEAPPAEPEDDPGNQVPPLGEPWLGHAENLVGVDGPADNAEWPWLLPLPDTPGVPSLWERIGPFRALKIHEPGTPHWVIDRVLAMRRPDGERQFTFTPVRIRHAYHAPLSAHDYARQVLAPVLDEHAVQRAEDDAQGGPLLYYTPWNEQNARPHDAPEGLGVAWPDVHGFVDYAIEVLEFARANYPMVYLLLPAPSPGYGVAEYNLWRDTMLRDIPSHLYDGMEGHYYWNGPATLQGEAERAARDAAALGPGKLFVVGECANVIEGVSKATKGRQLVQFVRAVMAEDVPNFVGAFAFTLFTSGAAWKDREVDPEFSEGVRKEIEGE